MAKGIYKSMIALSGQQPTKERVADFSYQNESLAQMMLLK